MTKTNTAALETPVVEEVTTLTTEQQEAIELAVNLEVHSGPAQDDVHAIVWSQSMNTSQKIKALASQGYKNAAIQKMLNPWYVSVKGRDLRYQHVRNVVLAPAPKKAV